MDYCKRMKELREKARLTQDKLAEIMGLETPNFISQIETGRKKVGLSVITKFCNALGMDISDFFSEAKEEVEVSQTIPLIDLTGASPDKLYDSNSRLKVKGLCRIDRPSDLMDEDAYAAIVSGESMAPALRDGDVVIVSPAQQYRDDDIAIVGLRSQELLLRKIMNMDGMLLLESSNPSMGARLINPADALFVHPVLWVRYRMPISKMPKC